MTPDGDSSRPLGRRQVLRGLGVAGALGLAGCTSDGGDSNATNGGPDTTTESSPTTTVVKQPTKTPTPEVTQVPDDSDGTRGDGTQTPTDSDATQTPTDGDDGIDVAKLESEVSNISFEGEFFDTHVHWHGAKDTRHDILNPATLATRYSANDIGAAALFTSTDEVDSTYESVLQHLADSEYDYLPFLEPDTFEHLVQGGVTELYESYPDVFAGIGEIVFYAGPFEGTSLTADPWPELFAFAAEKDLPLMIHPTQEQEEGLKTMLGRYPDATVMAHGGEFNLSQQKLKPILENNDNLYWTLDAGSMLNGLVLRASDASDFVSQYESREGDFKNLVQQTLPWMMEAAPDRIMWGTDLATDWNTDPEVISVVMEWTQAAMDSLSADQQDKYAYENARRLFGL